jgi:hypothetical protein
MKKTETRNFTVGDVVKWAKRYYNEGIHETIHYMGVVRKVNRITLIVDDFHMGCNIVKVRHDEILKHIK